MRTFVLEQTLNFCTNFFVYSPLHLLPLPILCNLIKQYPNSKYIYQFKSRDQRKSQEQSQYPAKGRQSSQPVLINICTVTSAHQIREKHMHQTLIRQNHILATNPNKSQLKKVHKSHGFTHKKLLALYELFLVNNPVEISVGYCTDSQSGRHLHLP